MKIGKVSILMLCLAISLFSCKKDDDNDTVETIPQRDRDEVQVEDKTEIVAYLESHYYNSTEFEAVINPSMVDVVITKLADGETTAPDGHTLLMESPLLKLEPIVFANTNYEFYILKLNIGGGDKSPTFADEVRVNHEGFLLDDDSTIFDSAVNPVNFDLATLIPGWRKALPFFKVAESFVDGSDGIIDYMNRGVGIMFLPSGLAYFSRGSEGIDAYTPIAFKFDLVQSFENDHDNDGVPSYLEELNGDGEFTISDPDDDTVTHDDTDLDNIANYLDSDDDGDGVPTINEDIDGDGDPTNDIGKNGIPKYLDPEETEFKS